jgi:hypothetical protein
MLSTLDIAQLRKIILGVDAKFSGNTSWRFVDAKFRFPNPLNPWESKFPEVVNLNNIATDVRADFVAVKVGDVNGTAPSEISPRSTGTFYLKAPEIEFKSEQFHRVAISGDFESIEGLQFTLGFDPNILELKDIEYGIAKEGNFGVFPHRGIITTSWEGNYSGGILATLIFYSKSEGKLSDVLKVNSRYTAAEAYNRDGGLMSVEMDFGEAEVKAKGFDLMQNIPNPFSGETVLGFVLPQEGEIMLKISDLQGRVIRVIKDQYNAGYNSVILRSQDLPSGVLQYTLMSGDYIETLRMVVSK